MGRKDGCKMNVQQTEKKLGEIALRIKEMREISGYSVEDMAAKTDITAEAYAVYETGTIDFPFTFLHKCATVFGIEITDLLEGHSSRLRSYTVTRKGEGMLTAKEDGINITNLAPLFVKKIAEPYRVKYEYSEEQQNKPIHLATHSGQEFDLVLSGKLMVQVGQHRELLEEGDSIYYDSSTPHGMIAVGGEDCEFCAVVLPGDEKPESELRKTLIGRLGIHQDRGGRERSAEIHRFYKRRKIQLRLRRGGRYREKGSRQARNASR